MQAVATNNYLLKGSYSASLRSSSDTFRFCLLCLSCLVISNQIKPNQNNQNNYVQNYYCYVMLIIKIFFIHCTRFQRARPGASWSIPGAAHLYKVSAFSRFFRFFTHAAPGASKAISFSQKCSLLAEILYSIKLDLAVHSFIV